MSLLEAWNWSRRAFLLHWKGMMMGWVSPLGALKDVAVIEAALTSDGKLLDLDKLVGSF
jgi:hypothetical protein